MNASGTVIDDIVYLGIGSVISESSPRNGDESGWTGRPMNGETGLQENRARQYDAVIARFWGEDPRRYIARDSNLHRFAHNNATNLTDPSGHEFNIFVDVFAFDDLIKKGIESQKEVAALKKNLMDGIQGVNRFKVPATVADELATFIIARTKTPKLLEFALLSAADTLKAIVWLSIPADQSYHPAKTQVIR